MLWLTTAVFTWLRSFVRSRRDLGVEIVALRHQLVVLKRRAKRARLQRSGRVFWIPLCHFWPHWAKSLLIVKPETVVGWHREGFRLYWRFRSRRRTVGRPTASGDIRTLIQTMAPRTLHLGRAPHPWRTIETRSPCFRADGVPLSFRFAPERPCRPSGRHHAGTLASGFNRCLAWAVFTIDIFGQKLHE